MERALASVLRPAARTEFREELRRNFMSAARRASTTPLFDVVEEPRAKPSSRRPSGLIWAGLLSAAAAVVVLLVYMKPSDSRWKVLDGSSAGVVHVDGVAIRGEDRERLERSLVEAHEIRSEGRLRLRFADWYLLELAPNSHVALSPIEQRARPEPLTFHVQEGTLRLRTGPSFRGEEMCVTTEDASLRVTGTNFAVDRVKDGTCICCLNGSIKVTPPKPQEVETVGGDRTYHVYRDGHPPKRDVIVEAHSGPLHELEELARQLWP
jgi:ferric-dicitrate binding protein FerR (iron transport regulator)